MNCKRCGNLLSGKQLSYCSLRCSKLHLKSLYRKRNRERLRVYNRKFKALGLPPIGNPKKYIQQLGGKCERCGEFQNLQVHHIRPLRFGGSNQLRNLMILCIDCHRKWHRFLTADFWSVTLSPAEREMADLEKPKKAVSKSRKGSG